MGALYHKARTRSKRAAAASIAVVAFLLAAVSSSLSTAAGDRALGEYLSAECVTCHQVSGQTTGGIPAIVAWPEDQFVAVLKSYKDKHRDNQVMQTITARLTEEEIAALAAYFGSLRARRKRN